MLTLRLLCIAAIFARVSAYPWDQHFVMGEVEALDNIQFLNLLIDLNSDETVLLNVLTDPEHFYGYNTSVSPYYRQLNQPFEKNYGPPKRADSSKISGFYAVDEAGRVISDPTNVTFALADKLVGNNPTTMHHRDDKRAYDGILGLGRKVKPGHQGFKDLVFKRGSTWCHGVECKQDEGSHSCSILDFVVKQATKDSFSRYDKNATYYGDLKPSVLNPIGWSLPVQGYQYGKMVSGRPFRVTLAPDSEFLTVPDSLFKVIISSLNATKDEETGLFTVARGDYTYAEPLQLNMNGKMVQLPVSDLIEWTFGGRFFLKVLGGASAAEWIVGEPFTDAVAVCLDFERDLASLFKVHLLKRDVRVTSKDFFERRELTDGAVLKQTFKAI